MSTKNTRVGGKFSGSHTSVVPLAGAVCDIAHDITEVTKISPGFIKAGLRPVRGKRRIKITDKETHILLSVRDNNSHQEIIVYADEIPATIDTLRKTVADLGVSVSVGG